MHFITYIDRLKKEYIEDNHVIDGERFHFYKQIELVGTTITNKIICLKKQYSYILLYTVSGIKIYLDDFDIVSILVYLMCEENDIGETIINSMYELLKGKKNPFTFRIDDEIFTIDGLPIINSDLIINTKADIGISIKEFIIILNLILAKEQISSKKNAVENIICKYICLAEYYGIKDEKSKNILFKSEFPLFNELKKNKNVIARAGDKKFVVDIRTFIKYKKI